MRCSVWKQEHQASGSHPWVRRCRTTNKGTFTVRAIRWAPGEYRALILFNYPKGSGQHTVYGKTLAAVKTAATRRVQKITRENTR